MNTTRQTKPAPSLRMSQGGMFDSLKRAVGAGPKETMREKFAREDAALKVKMAASAPAPAAAPAPKAVSDYVGNSALQRREKAAGLRDGGDLRTGQGGHVPGKGKGDKVPAKYEPGEFVVSNDMLDASPQLREQLHSLRGQVLAQKGMTPEQADAKALSGTGLRAQAGFDPLSRMAKDLTGQGSLPPRSPMGATAENLKRGPMGAQPQPGAATTRPTAPVSNAAGAVYDDSPEGRSSRQAFNQERAKAAGVGSKYDPASAKGPQAAVERPRAPTSAGPAKAPKMPTAPRTGAGAALAGVGIGTAANALQTPTENYRRRFGMDPNETSLGGDLTARAGGVITDLGADVLDAPVNLVNAVTPFFGGKGDLTLPGGSFKDIISQNDGQAGAAAPASTLRNPNQTAQTAQRTGLALKGGDAGRGNINPTLDGVLEAEDMRDPSGMTNAQIAARNPAGRVTKIGNSYSGGNVTGEVSFQGRDGNTLRGRPGGGFMVADAMPQAEINATLTNPDGSRWSARDNAIMAANLRDGADPYRGTSQGGAGRGADKYAGMPIKTAAAMRVADANNSAAQTRAEATNAVALRGQDMELEGRLAPARAAAAGRERVASYLRGPQGKTIDPAVGYRAALAAGDTDAAENIAKLMDMDDTRATKRNSAVDELLKPLSTFQGEDGKPGGVDDGLLQQNRAILEGLATSQNKTVDQLLADGPSARAAIQAINGMNSRKDNGFGQMIGWDKSSTLRRQLPNFEGATSEDVGFAEGLFTPQVNRGDRKINLANGEVVYLPQGTMSDQEVQNFLRGRGLDK